jgi:hypothetical protein
MTQQQPDGGSVRRVGRKAEPTPDERFPPLNPDPAQPPAPPSGRRPRRAWPYNLVALLFFVASVAIAAYYIVIARDPFSPLNPLPPFTPLPIIITTTPIPATATATLTRTPTATFTPLPREVIATLTTFTPAPFPFTMVESGVAYVANSNDAGCNWLSVGGTVTDIDGQPLNGYRVQIVGDNFNQTVVTGATVTFGQGGYEAVLDNRPRRAEYAVQLLTSGGIPLSQVYYVETSDVCSADVGENVAVVNFVQNRQL